MLQRFILSCLQHLPAELAHNIALHFLSYHYLSRVTLPRYKKDNLCAISLFGQHYTSSIGIAAGFDKNAKSLPSLQHLACGFIEIGTVTVMPQYGNDKPRLFRLKQEKSVINRMGFPNDGMKIISRRIKQYYHHYKMHDAQKIWINIGPNKDSNNIIGDYVALTQEFSSLCDALVINISSPNTKGLRGWQNPDKVTSIINAIKPHSNNVPICVKLAPDNDIILLSELSHALYECGINAIIMGNTTLKRDGVIHPDMANQQGGLSGELLKEFALQQCHALYTIIGDKLPIIGVGGISHYDDVIARLKAGASAVQLYSALSYAGPLLLQQMHSTLYQQLAEHNCTLEEYIYEIRS